MTKESKPKKFRNVLLIVLGIILISAGVVVLGILLRWWSFGNNYIKVNTVIEAKSVSKEIPIGYGKYKDLVCVTGLIVVENEGFLEWRNQLGEVVKKSDVKMNSPIMRSNKDYLVVAEAKGRKIEVYQKQTLLWRLEVDGGILNVDINQNGYVALVRKYTGFKSAVTVFNDAGKELFTAYRATNLIANAIVLPNNSTTVLNSINTNGCALETLIEFLGPDGNDINKYIIDNTVILKVLPMNRDMALLGSAKEVFLVAANGKQKFLRKFSSVQSVSALNSDIIAVAGVTTENSSSSSQMVQFLNTKNEVQNSLDFGSVIKSMLAMDDAVVVNLGRKVLVLNRHGQVLSGATLSSEVLKIFILEKGKVLLATSDNVVICNY